MKKLLTFIISLLFGSSLYFGGFKAPQYTDYPNPHLTPGELSQSRDEEYLKTHKTGEFRDVDKIKLKQCFIRYGLSYPQAEGKYECDHFYPLCLQGENSLKNLWPQPSPAFHDKDKVEAQLCRLFRKGDITLKESQNTIRHWRDYYEKNLKNHFGEAAGSDCDDLKTGCP